MPKYRVSFGVEEILENGDFVLKMGEFVIDANSEKEANNLTQSRIIREYDAFSWGISEVKKINI